MEEFKEVQDDGTQKKRNNHTEDDIQKTCVKWFRLQYPHLSRVLIHIPNGGFRNFKEAARLKAQGVVAGAPDLLLLTPSLDGEYAYLCIETKTPAPQSVQSDNQKDWERDIMLYGGKTKYIIYRTIEEFMSIIEGYLGKRRGVSHPISMPTAKRASKTGAGRPKLSSYKDFPANCKIVGHHKYVDGRKIY